MAGESSLPPHLTADSLRPSLSSGTSLPNTGAKDHRCCRHRSPLPKQGLSTLNTTATLRINRRIKGCDRHASARVHGPEYALSMNSSDKVGQHRLHDKAGRFGRATPPV